MAGFENIMPTFKGQVSEEEIIALIAFIQVAAGRARRRRGRDFPPPDGNAADQRRSRDERAMSTDTWTARHAPHAAPSAAARTNYLNVVARRRLVAADQGPQADRHSLSAPDHGDVLHRRVWRSRSCG